MSTAILLSNTPEGFFVAADGRSLRETSVFSDTEQKIFPIADEHACFAFAITGTVRFTPDGSEDENDIVFDFNTTIQGLAKGLSTTVFRGAEDYWSELTRQTNDALAYSVSNVKKNGGTVTYLGEYEEGLLGNNVAKLIVCGYYLRRPSQLILRFSHINQELQKVHTLGNVPVGRTMISGSRIVAQRLDESTDARFSRFRLPPSSSFIQRAVNYVAACSSEDGLAVDPDICRKIGGRVHAASVTVSQGFQWMPGFSPAHVNPDQGETR